MVRQWKRPRRKSLVMPGGVAWCLFIKLSDVVCVLSRCMAICCSKSRSSLPAEKEYRKNPMVKFKIADDDDDDDGAADTRLLPQSTDDSPPTDATSRV